MSMTHEAVNTAVVKTATAAQYGGSSAAVIFGLTANEFAALGGLFIGVIGFFVNWWYKHQHLRIAKKRKQENRDE